MLKRSRDFMNASNKRIKREKSLPNELIIGIFKYLCFDDKKKFKFLNRDFYVYYWNYVNSLKYNLDPKKHVFYTCTRPPRFFEFYDVTVKGEKKHVRFYDKSVKTYRRRLMKFKNDMIYCKSPEDNFEIYKIDRSEMNIIGKSHCDGCDGLEYCEKYSVYYCNLKNCERMNNHVHDMCKLCKMYDYYLESRRKINIVIDLSKRKNFN